MRCCGQAGTRLCKHTYVHVHVCVCSIPHTSRWRSHGTENVRGSVGEEGGREGGKAGGRVKEGWIKGVLQCKDAA